MTADVHTPASGADLVGMLEQFEGAQYLVHRTGQVSLNESGLRLEQVRNRVEQLAVTMDRSLAGAMWAELFLRYPWLSALTVQLWSEPEYDDEGGAYLTFHNSVSGVAYVPGEVVPADLSKDDGPDDGLVEDQLEGDIDEFDAEAHQALAGGRSGAVDLSRALSRDRLVGLLGQPTISGLAAFEALFPDD
jgi:hypothetical protein